MDKYTAKKIKNQESIKYIANYLSCAGFINYNNCGSFIEFFSDTKMIKKKVFQANFCENRFCPMCQFRLAVKEGMMINLMMEAISQEAQQEYLLVTLTAPNVKAEALSETLDAYNLGFKNLCKRKKVLFINNGYVRKIEVTYNKKRNDYHPHIHAVFAVDKKYFRSKKYLKQQEWLELWQEVMDDKRISQVNVKKAYKKDASFELAKYMAKSSDYTHSQATFDVFYQALKGRQLITYNGLFKEYLKRYKAKELDIYKTHDDTEYCYRILYRWHWKKYKEEWVKEMTQEEYQKLRKDAIDDSRIF